MKIKAPKLEAYKVTIGSNGRIFPTLEHARAFADRYFAKTGKLVGVVKVKSSRKK